MTATFLVWYLVAQLITAAALPLAGKLFYRFADGGWLFAKSLGVLLVGVILWLGTTYGVLRNEPGGAWLALAICAAGAWGAFGKEWIAQFRERADRNLWAFVLRGELVFLAGFVGWTIVRSYDPAANHTEQPMDMMFMNSIATSPTFPPRDAWLGGYAISYYYLGYWLLVTLAHLTGTAIPVAYNVGQALWFGLLLLGCYAAGSALAGLPHRANEGGETQIDRSSAQRGGMVAVMAIALAGNLMIGLEWLHALGIDMRPVARFLQSHNFPTEAPSASNWYVGMDWWWWRSSRVIQDLDLRGGHIEVIDEFPMFSYLLGDNHPHVLAMPFVLLVVGLAIHLYAAGANGGIDAAWMRWRRAREWLAALPMAGYALAIAVVASGALLAINTWDYPPYFALLVLCVAGTVLRARATQEARGNDSGRSAARVALRVAVVLGVVLLVGGILVYFPYAMTAQNQAGGLIPNLFHPTRIGQSFLMFGAFIPVIVAILIVGLRSTRPSGRTLIVSLALTYGIPAGFLLVSALLALNTERGQSLLSRWELPDGASGYAPFIVGRWAAQPWTFLIAGGGVGVALALLWERGRQALAARRDDADTGLTLALMLVAIGLGLVYVPEFVYLRDNFGTRMNTVFKFSYQAWLLLGLATAFAAARFLGNRENVYGGTVPALALLSVLGIGIGLLYPTAGIYGKTLGFSSEQRTLDAAAYIGSGNLAELAAVAWVRENTAADALVLEGKGASYEASTNRISTLTGRPTLLGWDGHESQWRGAAYAQMAAGRVDTLERIYRTAGPEEIRQLLTMWDIDYVYVGPSERRQYEITPRSEERLAEALDMVFAEGDARIYRRRN